MGKRNSRQIFHGFIVALSLSFAIAAAFIGFLPRAAAQTDTPVPTFFRIGEKLSYNISFGKFSNGGYAEMYVASRGKMSGKDVVEIRSKATTQGLVGASFFLIDERRTVFAAPDTGLPLYIKRIASDGPLPMQTVSNFLKDPTPNFDLLTMIYKAREAGGVGTYPFVENDRVYTASFQTKGNEKVKTEAGGFDTTVSVVQSELFNANGIKEFKINFSNDVNRVPVLIRIKTAKGEFQASLLSVNVDEPVVVTASPTPTPRPVTPPTRPTPRPTPTPEVYVDNQPLSPDLGFAIGESLVYNISSAGKPLAAITVSAVERKQFQRKDSLLLTAVVTGTENGTTAFRLGDAIRAQVDPDTLAPSWYQSKFDSSFAGLNQTVTIDQKTGNVTFGAGAPFDGPVGTHCLLSLFYAMRSFNLQTSKDLTNPVNDTRVAVFWETKPYIFTLRPGNSTSLTINGQKVPAQQITVNTGIKQLDDLRIKVWLAAESRVPVRIVFGAYQADLAMPVPEAQP